MHISRLAAIAAIPLALAGCISVSNPVKPKTVYELQATFNGGFLVPADHYKRLGLCVAGTSFSAANPCADRGVVLKLQAFYTTAQGDLTTLRKFVLANPTLDASALYSAATLSVNAAIAAAVQYGVATSTPSTVPGVQ